MTGFEHEILGIGYALVFLLFFIYAIILAHVINHWER